MSTMLITMSTGEVLSGTPEDIIHALKLRDWAGPQSVLEFKKNVENRTLVGGIALLYWDATSFLLAMEAAGLCKVETVGLCVKEACQ